MAQVPSEALLIQEEEVDFRSPMSESTLQKLGGSINWLMDNIQIFAVGEVLYSFLTEVQFQGEMGTQWVLCDGRDVTGSRYTVLTGDANIPDARGLFFRSQNGDRSTSTGNPDGNLAIGTQVLSANAAHSHVAQVSDTTGPSPSPANLPRRIGKTDGVLGDAGTNSLNMTATPPLMTPNVSFSGGNEQRPYSVTCNIFIKID